MSLIKILRGAKMLEINILAPLSIFEFSIKKAALSTRAAPNVSKRTVNQEFDFFKSIIWFSNSKSLSATCVDIQNRIGCAGRCRIHFWRTYVGFARLNVWIYHHRHTVALCDNYFCVR
jgi:hypothetical protein